MPTEAMESWRPEAEDGLTLFQHMQARESRNYLNNCNDDIEEVKYEGGLSTFRISGSTPTRIGGGLLIPDIQKSDYNWLLTPPGTPLFPSLDQEPASINFTQRTSGSTINSSKVFHLQEPSSKPPTESPSQYRGSRAFSPHNPSYTNLSPQRSVAVSPTRTLASSGKAKSPSASSSPSLRRLRPTAGAMSPSGSARRPPARPNKSSSSPSTPMLCRSNTSPSSASRCGYLAYKGPRRSLSPNFGRWETVLASLSTEPPPNLRTSPSSRSLQRGKSGCARQVDFDTHQDALCARELAARKNRNRDLNNAFEVSKCLTRCEDNKYNSSPFREKSPAITCTKEMISTFASGKLTDQQALLGRNSQIMSRPLMMCAPSTSIHRTGLVISKCDVSSPSVLPSMFMTKCPTQSITASPQKGCSQGKDKIGKDPQDNWSVDIDSGKLEGTKDSRTDRTLASGDCILPDEAIKEPIKSEGNSNEETGVKNTWDNNHTCLFEESKGDSAHKDIQIAGAQGFTCLKLSKSDKDAGVNDSDILMKGLSKKHRKHILLAHSCSGESQMQNVKFGRGRVSEHNGEDNRVFNPNKVHSPLRHNLNKDDMKAPFEDSSTLAFTSGTYAGSQDNAYFISSHPARRQSCSKNVDMVYGTWNMKKAGSFDIATSDSYSCSESLDSSYIDNHTERFCEDLSETDSMSHTGYSLSTSSMNEYLLCNLVCAGKLLTEVPTELGMGEARSTSVSGGLEETKLPTECCDKEQYIQSRNQSQASIVRDTREIWAPSPGFQNQVVAVAERNGLDTKDLCSFLDAHNKPWLEIQQLTASKPYSEIDLNGEYATKTLIIAAAGGDAGKSITSKSTSEEKTGCEYIPKKKESPLRRSVTLEEATDTILFCSSIVHEIVYKSASLGEEKCSSSIQEPPKVWGHLCGSSSSWRTSKALSLNKREPACFMAAHVLSTSDKVVLPSTHEAVKTNHQRKKKSLCGCGLCLVM